MTRTQYLSLKEELKKLSYDIHNQKATRRLSAQAFTKFQKENHTFNDFYKRRITDSDWLPIEKEYWTLAKEAIVAYDKANEMKAEYRVKHVAYCLARGRTLKEIEPHVREGNELDQHSLKKILVKYEIDIA